MRIQPLIKLGEEKIRRGEFLSAIEDFAKVIRLDPKNYDAHLYIGICYKMERKFHKALKEYNQAISISKLDPRAYYHRGAVLNILCRCEESLKDLDYFLQREPKCVEAINLRGIVNMTIGRHDQSLRDFLSSIEIKPESAESYMYVGIVLRILSRAEEALIYLTQSISIDPNFDKPYFLIGQIYNETENTILAIQNFDEAIKRNSTNENALYQKAMALTKLGRNEEARITFSDLQRAQSENQHNKRKNQKGFGSEESKKVAEWVFKKMEEKIDLIRTIDPKKLSSMECLEKAREFVKREDYESALQYLEESVTKDPTNAKAFLERSRIHHKMEKKNKAFEDLKQAARLKGAEEVEGEEEDDDEEEGDDGDLTKALKLSMEENNDVEDGK